MNLHRYTNAASVFEALSERLANQLDSQPGPFHLALSGGGTALVMFRYWVEGHRERIPWERIRFYWADERCVPPTDDQSNFKHADEELFRPLGIPPGHIHRMRGECPPEKEALRYGRLLRQELPQVEGEPRFDAIILGIGQDGHTASIFPDQTALLTETAPCAVGIHPQSSQPRITLTGPVILNAARIYVPVTGIDKRPIVERLLGVPPQTECIDESLPAGYILSQARAAELYTDSLDSGVLA